MGKTKITVKKIDETQTPFRPVPYETTDVRTSIALLTSVEIEVVIKALSTLTRYSNEKDLNVSFLYKNGVVQKLVELLAYEHETILRFALKLLSQIVSTIPDAALELSFEQYKDKVKQIAHLFMTTTDNIVKEFSIQFLAQVVKTHVLATSMLKMGILVSIFEVLNCTLDVDIQFNTLICFGRILESREAKTVVPQLPDFSLRTLLCYTRHETPEVKMEAVTIIERLASWGSSKMQGIMREEKAIEEMFALVMDEENVAVHTKCLNVIVLCMKCTETASYFVESLEFIKFTQWAKTCEAPLMLPSITILVALFEKPSLKQLLFDFSVEDSVLSFFRTDDEDIFMQTCEGVSYMSAHKFCCEKIVTPMVIKTILHILTRNDVLTIPYHEMAIKTLLTLLKRNENTASYIVGCSGLDLLKKAALRNKNDYTFEGLYNILYVFFIFSSKAQYRALVMDLEVYRMLFDRLEEDSEYSSLSVLIIDQYINDPEYREHLLEYDGLRKIIALLTSTSSEELFKNILLFLERMFAYRKLCMSFLWLGGLNTLEKLNNRVKTKLPTITRLITMVYNLYLPLKFFKQGRLEITDHFDAQFYLVDSLCDEFPFLELMESLQMSARRVIYVVDFGAKVDELMKKEMPKFDSRSARKSSIKSSSKFSSPTIRRTKDYKVEDCDSQMLCRVPPPINYGYVTQDPYLPQYLVKLRKSIYENDNYIFCFEHQIKAIAKFVDNVLSGPPYPGGPASKNHCMEVHLRALKEKLGTSTIPLGYLRYGFHRERALLFKALSDKLGVPCTLMRGKNNKIYWNEVPLMYNEQYENVEDLKTYMAYAVIDLMNKVGNLMLVGTIEANEYCGLPLPGETEKIQIMTLRNVIDV